MAFSEGHEAYLRLSEILIRPRKSVLPVSFPTQYTFSEMPV